MPLEEMKLQSFLLQMFINMFNICILQNILISNAAIMSCDDTFLFFMYSLYKVFKKKHNILKYIFTNIHDIYLHNNTHTRVYNS